MLLRSLITKIKPATFLRQKTFSSNTIQNPYTFLEVCEKDNVIPDVLIHSPSAPLQVCYGDKKKSVVNFGNELKPSITSEQPSLSWPSMKNKFYTVLMVDPDAPSRSNPYFREFVHWHVVNIPGKNVSKGKSVVDYVGPCPPAGTGLHRYVLMVFQQENEILRHLSLRVSRHQGLERRKFNTLMFAVKYKLIGPVAMNYFQAEFDDAASQNLAQIGFQGLKRSRIARCSVRRREMRRQGII